MSKNERVTYVFYTVRIIVDAQVALVYNESPGQWNVFPLYDF